MKSLLIAFSLILISWNSFAQLAGFPRNWEGDWKGELTWYQTGKSVPQKMNMELRIHPTDSSNTWTWQIIYGSEKEDTRPYTLKGNDSTGVHWLIDENNGIVLDQFFVGNKFCGAFTVMNATIVNNYWMEDGKMMIEFFSISAKPLTTTGKGTAENPKVDSYKIGSYQHAVLTRKN